MQNGWQVSKGLIVEVTQKWRQGWEKSHNRSDAEVTPGLEKSHNRSDAEK